ncbi:MAG: L,D-transpeptidase family protein, partial [Bdellovibrionales bacterium]
FKNPAQLELWIQEDGSARYALYKTYPICNYSGALGPKLQEGDKQAPEGFYQVSPQSMNPNSNYHLSFNIGFPNKFDKSLGRTGSLIMVHGGCESSGCYAMTDPAIEEIYAIVEMAHENGQYSVPVHIFPFPMTSENLAVYKGVFWYDFWKNLRTGYDYFEMTKIPPRIFHHNGRYMFKSG